MAGRYDELDNDPDYEDLQSGRVSPQDLLPQARPEPPQIQSFATPAQAAAPTTPQPAPQAAPQPPEPATAEEFTANVAAEREAGLRPVLRPHFADAELEAKASAEEQRQVQRNQQIDARQQEASQRQQQRAAEAAQESARQQAIRDNAASLRYQRGQGVAMQTNPDGNVTPQYDEAGNVKYKPAVVQPFTRLEDGRAYRVSRDEYGAHKYHDILAEGQEGVDYHTDGKTGEHFVMADDGQGGKKREVLGVDPYIPKITALRGQIAQNAAQASAFDIAAAEAQQGFQGESGLRAMSLTDLRDLAKTLDDGIHPLRGRQTALERYQQGGGTLNSVQLDSLKNSRLQLEQREPQAQALAEEIEAREGTIAEAHQQKTALQKDSLAAHQSSMVLSAARAGAPTLRQDLHTILNGGALPQEKAALYVQSGLLAEEAQPDGSTILRVTRGALGVMPRPYQQMIQANSGRFVLADPSPEADQMAKQVAKVAQRQEAVQPEEPADPVAGQDGKPYAIGEDGKISLDSARPAKAIVAAWRDGKIDNVAAKELHAAASKVEETRAGLAGFFSEHPKIAAAIEGTSTGGAFLAGARLAPLAATASGLNTAIAGASAPLGPFAWVPPAIAAAAEAVGGGLLAVKAKHALEGKIAEHLDAVRALQEGAQKHPGIALVGELAVNLPHALTSVGNLTKIGSIAAADLGAEATTGAKALAAGKAVGKVAGVGAVGGAVAEGAIRPTVEAGLHLGADALGIEHEPTQAPTIGSIAQMAGLGALLFAHSGVEFHDYSPRQLGSILNRGTAHAKANVDFKEPIPHEKLAEIIGDNPKIDNLTTAELAKPLTAAEWEIYWKAKNKIDQLNQAGVTNFPMEKISGSARQATRGGEPMGVASTEIRPEGGSQSQGSPSRPGPSANLPSLPNSPIAPESSGNKNPADAPENNNLPPAGNKNPSETGENNTSAPSSPDEPGKSGTIVPVSGAADAPKTTPIGAKSAPVIAELTRQRAGQQALLNRPNVTPEDARDIQVRVDYLDGRIAELGQAQESELASNKQAPPTETVAPSDTIPVKQEPNGTPEELASQVAPDMSRDISSSSTAAASLGENDLRGAHDRTSTAPSDKESAMAGDIPAGNKAAPEKRGSTQLTFSEQDATPFRNFARSIPESDIYSEKKPDGSEKYGRESEPHVTALYGLTGKGDQSQAVAEAARNHGPIKLKLGKLSVFSNPDAPYDVLKADVHSPELHALNGKLRGLEHKSDFPDYQPHATIAYLKKGAGAKYVGAKTFEGREITVGELTHSSANREKTKVHLGDGPSPRARAAQAALDSFKTREENGIELTPEQQRMREGAKRALGEEAAKGQSNAPTAASASRPPTFAEAAPIIRQAIREKVGILRAAGQPVPAMLERLIEGGRSPNLSPAGQARYLAEAAKADAEHGLGLAERGAHLAGSQSAAGRPDAGPAAKAASDAAPANTAKANIPAGNQAEPQAAPEPAPLAPELMTPEQWLERNVEDYQYLSYAMRSARLAPYERRQRAAIETAFAEGRPVHVQAAHGYGIKPPRGYRQVGDQFERPAQAEPKQDAAPKLSDLARRATKDIEKLSKVRNPSPFQEQMLRDARKALAEETKSGSAAESAPAAPAAPVSERSRRAQVVVRKLEDLAARGGKLSADQQRGLENNRRILAEEAQQDQTAQPAAPPSPAPLSEKAKHAQIFVAAMEEHLAAGRQLGEYQQGRLAKARQTLAQEGQSNAPQPTPAPASPVPQTAPLAVGDSISVKGRPDAYKVQWMGEKAVGATDAAGKSFTFPKHMVSKAGHTPDEGIEPKPKVAPAEKPPTQPSPAPAAPSAPPKATAPAAISKGSQVTYQGRPAVVKNMDEGKPFAFITMAADPARGLPEKRMRAAIADLRPAADPASKPAAPPEPAPAASERQSATTGNRQPATAAGKEAQRTLARLAGLPEKGIELNWSNRQAQREAELDLARDLNHQVLGPHPKPATDAGKHALANIEAWEPLRGEFNAGQLLSLHGEYARLEQDFTAQRLAIESREQSPARPPAAKAAIDPFAPIDEKAARKVAERHIEANRPLLERLGMTDAEYAPTTGRSGIEFSSNGILRIDTAQLARTMETVRDNQEILGLKSTPEDWFAQVIFHEGIHAADALIAHEKGQTFEERYNELPNEAMPKDWEQLGAKVIGEETWKTMKDWQRKAEFVRMILEGKWTGKISEQLHRFLKKIVKMLKRIAGHKDTDPRFKAHVQEVETRVDAARGAEEAKAPPVRPKARGFRIPASPTGAPDVIDRILEQGGILAKGKMAKAPGFSAADYEGLTALPGVYKRLLTGKLSPDKMAAQLGLDGSQHLTDEIHKAIASRKSVRAEGLRQDTAEKQAERFDKDALTAPKQAGEAKALSVSNLSVGDKVEIGGETLRVRGIDPDTLEVTLEDHRKYGIQKVEDGQAIYVESAQLQEHAADDFGPAEAESFSLESVSPEQLRAEERSRAQKEAIAKGQSKPLAGSAGDLTADIFGEGETPLFNERRDNGTLGATEPEGEAPTRREQTRDPSRAASIRALVDHALTPGTGERKRFVQYGAINPEQAARLKADTGLDLEGYRRNLDNSAVRHVWQQHGDPQAEIRRGNLPISKVDFERLPELLERPDASLLVGKNRLGQDIILSAKRVNGYYVIAEEVRGNRVLNLTTIYKKSAHPPANDATQGATPLFTPEALRSIAQGILRQIAGQRNFLHGGDSGAVAPAPQTSFADAAPIIRQAIREKAAELRAAGQPIPPLLDRLIEGGRSPNLSPTGQARYLADAARADAEHGLGLTERGVNLPGATRAGTPEQGQGNTLAAATPEAAPAAEAGAPQQGRNKARQLWKERGVKSPFFKKWFGDWQKDPATASKAVDAKGAPLPLYHGSPELTRGSFDEFRVSKDALDLLAGTGVYLTDNRKLGQTYTVNREGVLSGSMVDIDSVPKDTPVMELYANVRKPFDAGAGGMKAVREILAKEIPDEEFGSGPKVAQIKAEQIALETSNTARVYGENEPLLAYRALREVLTNYGLMQRYGAGDPMRETLERHGFDGIRHVGGVLGGQKHDVWVAFRPEQVKSAEPAGSSRSNSGDFDSTKPNILFATEPEPIRTSKAEPWRKEVRDEDAQKHFDDMIPPAQRGKATEEDQRFARFVAKERAADDARERWIERAAKAAKLTKAETEFAKDFDAEDPDTWNNAAQAAAPKSALNDLAEYEDFDANDPDTWGEHNTREVQRHWSLYEATDGGKKLDDDPNLWPDELSETIEGQELATIIDEPADNIADWPLDKRQRNEAQKLADEIADFDPKDADSAVENYLSEAEQEAYGEAHDNYSGILADDPATWPEEHQDKGNELLQAARKSANDPAATAQRRDTAREAFFDYRKTQIAPIVGENRAKFEALEQKALAAAKEHFAPKQARYDALEKSAVEAAQQRVDALRKSGDARIKEAARIVEAASSSAEGKAKEHEQLSERDEEGGDASDAAREAAIKEHDALMRRLRAAVDAAQDDSGVLFATDPTPEVAPLGQRIKEKLAARREQSDAEDRLAAGKDAAETLASAAARQAGNSVRIDFGTPKELSDPNSRANKDLEAMPFVIEARGDKAALAADLEKIKAGKDPKLSKQYAPVLQHALDNFDRLRTKAPNYLKLAARQRQEEIKEGVNIAGINEHVGRILHDPDNAHDLHPLAAFGMNAADAAQPRYLMRGGEYKKLADAIADGHAPQTANLADLTEQRVRAGQRLIHEARFRREAAGMKARDGKPILGGIIETAERLNADGSKTAEQKLPSGYEAVQAAGEVLTVHKDFAPIMRALYGDSAIRGNAAGRFFLKAAAFAKHNTLIFDSYHLFRIAAKANLGFQTGGHKKGLAGLNYGIEDLDRAVEAGHLTKEEAAYARETHEVADKLLRGGLNVGRVADNLMEAAHAQGLFNKVPLVGPGIVKFNHWMFNQYQRGVVMQAGTIAYERNRARFPEMSDEAVVRQSAKEVNEFFGNLGNQGWLRSKTMQDAARMVGFAPNWAESQFKSEARGIAQMGKVPADALRGKGLRVGNVAQAMGGIILASLIGNQLLNLFTRHKLTWQNEEEGHKWDAWIPGGAQNRGFWFSPLSIAAEYTHAMIKYLEKGENALDAALHIGGNKLSPGARGLKDLITGEDYAGRPFGSMGERIKMAAIDALPSPLPLSGVVEKDPKAALGYRLNKQPGSLEKQGLSMVGLKVDAEPSARSKMYQIADKFRGGPAQGGTRSPSEYAGLRHALDREDRPGAEAEVRRLLEEGKPLNQIGRAFGVGAQGKFVPEHFTGGAESERKMLGQLTPEQKRLYLRAQGERRAGAEFFKGAAASVLRSPQMKALASRNAERARHSRRPAQAMAALTNL
jgi:hypothetical protein